MATILRHVTVVRDGLHNAFTSLQYWRGQYWVSYRKGPFHHFSPGGRAIVACSADRERFQEVASLKTPGDTRDPRLVITRDDRLAAFVHATIVEEGRRIHCQYLAFSDDGYTWSKPQPILAHKEHLFRLRRHHDTWWGLSCYRDDKERELHLFRSEDLVDWTHHADIGRPDQLLNESDVYFQPDGEAWIVSRSLREDNEGFLCRSPPPYTDWQVKDLGLFVHCPVLLPYKDHLYLVGRSLPQTEGDLAWPWGRSLAIWKMVGTRPEPVLRIPACGDCAYPGLIVDPEGRICMSYYSQHAYYMGVVPPFSGRRTSIRYGETQPDEIGMAADVYFAEINLD